MVKPENWEWFGNAGHFICSRWCRFHLTTKVGKYVVSTVGEYVHPRHGGGSELAENEWLQKNWPGEDVGYNRKFETMVFLAGARCSAEGCGCRMPAISGPELETRGCNSAGEAARNHLQACKKWSKKA